MTDKKHQILAQIDETLEWHINVTKGDFYGQIYIDTIQAALKAARELVENGGWQDISSAPKDGTPILGYNQQYDQTYLMKWQRATTFFSEGWYHCTMVAGGYGSSNDSKIPFKDEQPTHWKPLDSEEKALKILKGLADG